MYTYTYQLVQRAITMTMPNLVLRTVYISPEVDDKLRTQAYEERKSKNDLIRRYIDLGMKAARQDGSAVSRQASAKKIPTKR